MKLSRKELYDLVWQEPMTTLSKKLGITDNGLRKHCKSMNIPTPPMGYWSKVKFGKKPEAIPLQDSTPGDKQNTIIGEVDVSKPEITFTQSDRNKIREVEISCGDTSCFIVPPVLYAKDSLIIDTKEKHRIDAENVYLKKNPYKNKMGPTLDVYVSGKTIDRALCIFATIIKALKFRGHDIKIKEHRTYAFIDGEDIQISITERKKRNLNSENPYDNQNNIFCGELHFNIYFGYREVNVIRDTPNTKLEDKIITIVAKLEIRAEKIKEERIEQEKWRIKREKEERERKEFEQKRDKEYEEFKTLFTMAERLHKTTILRTYIFTYEKFVMDRGELTDEITEKINWAREKADWLDPFISRKDKYLDFYKKDEIIQPECPKKDIWDYSDYYSVSPDDSFWSNPFRKW